MSNDIEIKIFRDDKLSWLDNLTGVIARAKKSGIRKAARTILKSVQDMLLATDINGVRNINPKYNDSLFDAIRMTKLDVDGESLKVHIMGTKATGSGTYRLRFFEGGTKERFAQTYKGKPLKKPRKLGHIGAYNFFDAGVETSRSTAEQAMMQQIKKIIAKEQNG